MKKKIFSILCSFCMLITCAMALTACKKDKNPPSTPTEPEKVISSAFYLGETKLTESSLAYNFGDAVLEELETVSFVASVDKASQTVALLESNYVLSYNNFETTSTLNELPEEWNAGTYTFALNVTVAEETINGSLIVSVNKIASENVFDLKINHEDGDATVEYDISENVGNDPVFEIYQESELVADAVYQMHYLSASDYEAYSALTTAAEKYEFLDSHKTTYTATYQMVPADYYMFAAVENGINYKDTFTNPVKLTITTTQRDYSMVNIQMNYTYNAETCTGEYVTLDQIVEEIGMPTIEEFEGTIEWADDYSDLQFIYSAADPTISLQVKLTPSNPYIEYSKTIIDVTLTLNQGLIQIPTLIDENLTFLYTGAEQGITIANGSQFFINWFTEENARFIESNFETHTDVGNYSFTATLSSPNFAFTEDGETASETTEITVDWSIEKANHHCYVVGLSTEPIHVVNSDTIEVTETYADNLKLALPTLEQFYYELYLDQELQYEIIDAESTGEASIIEDELVVATAGTIVLKITNPGSANVEAIEVTIIYTIA